MGTAALGCAAPGPPGLRLPGEPVLVPGWSLGFTRQPRLAMHAPSPCGWQVGLGRSSPGHSSSHLLCWGLEGPCGQTYPAGLLPCPGRPGGTARARSSSVAGVGRAPAGCSALLAVLTVCRTQTQSCGLAAASLCPALLWPLLLAPCEVAFLSHQGDVGELAASGGIRAHAWHEAMLRNRALLIQPGLGVTPASVPPVATQDPTPLSTMGDSAFIRATCHVPAGHPSQSVGLPDARGPGRAGAHPGCPLNPPVPVGLSAELTPKCR